MANVSLVLVKGEGRGVGGGFERGRVRPVRTGPARMAAVAPVSAGATPALRLTARGRLVVRVARVALTSLVVALVVLAGVALFSGRAQATSVPSRVPTEVHVMEPGETLWQVAQASDPGADPREVVQRIVELNNLTTANVQSGTRLLVPAS